MTNKKFAEKYKGRKIVLNKKCVRTGPVDGGIVIGYSPNNVWYTCNDSFLKLNNVKKQKGFTFVVENVNDNCRVDGIDFSCLDVVEDVIDKQEIEYLKKILEL